MKEWIDLFGRVIEAPRKQLLGMWLLMLVSYFALIPLVPEPNRAWARVICAGIGSTSFIFWLLGFWESGARKRWPVLRLPRLMGKERLLLSFFVDVDRQSLWLPNGDSAVRDLCRKGLLEQLGVISRQGCSPYRVPDRVWDYLRFRWKDRVTGAELGERTEALNDWISLTAIQERHGQR